MATLVHMSKYVRLRHLHGNFSTDIVATFSSPEQLPLLQKPDHIICNGRYKSGTASLPRRMEDV